MTDYISRDAAIEAIRLECNGCVGQEIGERFCSKCAIRQIEVALYSIPTADVRPVVHGEWIVDSIASNIFNCSVCGCDAPVEPTGGTEYESNFCPYCGADMRPREETPDES